MAEHVPLRLSLPGVTPSQSLLVALAASVGICSGFWASRRIQYTSNSALTKWAPKSNRRDAVRSGIATSCCSEGVILCAYRFLRFANVVGPYVSQFDLAEAPRRLLLNIDVATGVSPNQDVVSPRSAEDSAEGLECG
jgi:hypothetical protein